MNQYKHKQSIIYFTNHTNKQTKTITFVFQLLRTYEHIILYANFINCRMYNIIFSHLDDKYNNNIMLLINRFSSQ